METGGRGCCIPINQFFTACTLRTLMLVLTRFKLDYEGGIYQSEAESGGLWGMHWVMRVHIHRRLLVRRVFSAISSIDHIVTH